MRVLRWIVLAQLALGTTALAQQDPAPALPPITEPASQRYLPGKFVWADLFSSDIVASRGFYEQVFGWEWRQIKEPPRPYGLFYVDGEPVAGLAYREAPDGGELYGRWIHFISVRDVGATEQAVGQRGGRVLLSHRTFEHRGEFAILRDADAAPFGVMRSSSGDPGDYRAAFGEWIWHQLYSRAPAAAVDFYTELFAYESERDLQYPEIAKYLLKSHGYLRAGIGQLSADTGTAPTWLGFIRVDNIDATLKRALDHGGKVLLEPKEAISDSGLAIVADPTGATIGLLRWDYEDASQEVRRP